MSAILLRPATPDTAAECLRIRALTRENAFSADELAALGITVESWRAGIESGELIGQIAWDGQTMAGYCFGDRDSGEIMVLALQPQYEGQGLGRRLLASLVETFAALGFQQLFLACSSDPAVRSYGFYRHLGWTHTGESDEAGDHILSLPLSR